MLFKPSTSFVLIVSAALGAVLGWAHADWQWALEHAQIDAGLVHYAADSPLAIARAKLPSLIPQGCAVLLSLGVSEILLSKLLSVAMGVLSFQALALIVYALNRDALLATGSALVIYVAHVAEYGTVYPIWLLGTSHTYGVFGLSVVVLALGLIGAGRNRAGAFLVGLAPAVHLGLGAWLILVVTAAGLWHQRWMRQWLTTNWKPLVAGFVVTIVSTGIHVLRAPHIPSVDPTEAARYFDTFVGFWDGHRQPVDLASAGVRLTAGLGVVGLVALRWGAAGLSSDAAQLLRMLIISAVAGLGAAVITHVPVDQLSRAVIIVMPGRFLNVPAMTAVAVLFGLAGLVARRRHVALLVPLLAVGLLVSRPSRVWPIMGWDGTVSRPSTIDALSLVGGVAVVLIWTMVLIARRTPSRESPNDLERDALSPGRKAARAALLATILVAAGFAAIDARRAVGDRREFFVDRTSDPVYLTAAGTAGVLATAGDLHLMQLRTRRPLLVDGSALDVLPYALEAAPALDRILREVYGLDLFHPPAEAHRAGRIPPAASRVAWEAHSEARWREIRRAYQVTQVLAWADWRLHLPLVAESRGLRLYAIPE